MLQTEEAASDATTKEGVLTYNQGGICFNVCSKNPNFNLQEVQDDVLSMIMEDQNGKLKQRFNNENYNKGTR